MTTLCLGESGFLSNECMIFLQMFTELGLPPTTFTLHITKTPFFCQGKFHFKKLLVIHDTINYLIGYTL